MRKIRVGNDFWQSFQVKENGVIVDLLQIKDTVQVFAKVGDKSFEVPIEMIKIKEDGIITMEVKTELFNIVGRYEIIVKYWHHDISMSDNDRKQAVNFMPFAIVSTSAIADDLEDVPIVGDIIIGLKGDSAFDIWNAKNGGDNTYQDWIAFLQAPATEIEGIVSANEAVRIENENTRKANEQTRQSNESARVTAEIDREENEGARTVNEAIRITNEDIRITNENQRVVDENKRETLYDDVVILKDETEIARDGAITATENAELATSDANDAAILANEKAEFAEQQGNFAKTEANKIPALIAGKADKVQEEWITPTLLNGWVGTAQYIKDTLGFVHFQGTINSGDVSQNTILLNLPAGYRPSTTIDLPQIIGGYIRISSTGSMYIRSASTSQPLSTLFSLSMIFFKAG